MRNLGWLGKRKNSSQYYFPCVFFLDPCLQVNRPSKNSDRNLEETLDVEKGSQSTGNDAKRPIQETTVPITSIDSASDHNGEGGD